MGFWYDDIKQEEPKRRRLSGGVVPIESLARIGCAACPRDQDRSLKMPKAAPEGDERPDVYLLAMRPTSAEDGAERAWSGVAGRAVENMFRSSTLDRARWGHTVQCAPAFGDEEGHKRAPDHEQACCRPRAVSDIERSRPRVVVGYGAEPLHWATGLPRDERAFRGTPVPARFGAHVCWYYPLTYPNWTSKKRRAKSEYEWAMERDVAWLEDNLDALGEPAVIDGPYDRGIVRITGREEGDIVRLEEAFHDLVTSGRPEGLDIETTGLRPHMERDPLILTAAVGSFERTYAFAVEHPDGWGTEGRVRRVSGAFAEMLAQLEAKVCHNAGFEQEWLAFKYGPHMLRRTRWEDTMAAAHAFDERDGTKSLDVQCRLAFGFFLKAQSSVDVTRPRWWESTDLPATLRYNGMDSKWSELLWRRRERELRADPRALALYERQMETAPTLVLMSARGLPVDFGYARDLSAGYAERLAKIAAEAARLPEVRAYAARFGTFSISNNDHVLRLFKDVMGRPEVEKEDWDGNVRHSTDEEALESMPATVRSARLVLDHRAIERNQTTYLGPLLEGQLTGPDGELHYDYSSMHTATGRLSSRAHNWPKHKFKEVRGAVAERDGQWLMACDYGQIEFRVCGMLSGDDAIVRACWTKYDVHKHWAERMLRLYPDIKDRIVEDYGLKDWEGDGGLKKLRQEAKNGWVFPLLFGSRSESCAGRMQIPLDVAADLAEEFWDEFRGVKRWQERVVADYHRDLYVETLGGFRRHGPMTENELINMPIQGTAAELVKEAMCAISLRSELEDWPDLMPAFNGHDDLTFRVRDGRLEETMTAVVAEMCMPRFDYVNVPLLVEVSVGPRWHQLEEVGTWSSESLYNLTNPYKET